MGYMPKWAQGAIEAMDLKGAVPWSTGEIHASCPQCGGSKRFIVWESGRSWCRECKYTHSWKEETDQRRSQSTVLKARAAAWEMLREDSWISYHRQALESKEALDLWTSYGLEEQDLIQWGLGYTSQCPLYPRSPSLTIPVFGGGRLLDIRHRLIKTTPLSGKYRSHVSGLGLSVNLFNRDALRVSRCLVVEGEIKSIVLEKYGIATCGIYGAGGYGELEATLKKVNLSLVLALDPDAEEQALDLAHKLSALGSDIWLAYPIMKPDDFVLQYGTEPFFEIIRQARRVK